MIDPKELQFGNFIMDDEGCLARVAGFEPHGHSVRCDEPEGCKIIFDLYGVDGKIKKGYENESDSCSPIELNSHWMDRCGFETPDGYNTSVLYNEIMIDFHLGEYKLRDKPKAQLKYLHQLQNVFYWLTGEELTIKIT